MKLMAVRRAQLANSGRSEVPLPPAPPPHPGYAPNAALHAIKRHAQEFAAPKAAAVSSTMIRLSRRRNHATSLYASSRLCNDHGRLTVFTMLTNFKILVGSILPTGF